MKNKSVFLLLMMINGICHAELSNINIQNNNFSSDKISYINNINNVNIGSNKLDNCSECKTHCSAGCMKKFCCP